MRTNLFEIIYHACNTVPLYKQLYSDFKIGFNDKYDLFHNFEKIPLITKNTLIESEYSCISKNVIERFRNNELIKIPTSGSTGKCLEVYWDESDYRKSLIPLWLLRKKRYNVLPKDKKCLFFTNQYQNNRVACCPEMFFHRNELLISKNNWDSIRIKNSVEAIIRYSPKWMILQPSIALLLASYIQENNIHLDNNLKYIELTGEMLFKSNREKIERYFSCSVSNQYGTNEVNSIAFECSYGNLHVLEECNLVEIIENGKVLDWGEEGNIYVTSLYNYAMPFIRYETGDKGVLYPYSECKCGCKSKILKLTKGRNNDFVVNKDGSKIHSYVFVHVIETINDKMDGVIRQFQVIQEDFDCFNVKLVIENLVYSSEEIKQMIINLFLSNLMQKSLYNSRFYFEFYNELFPNKKTGKLQYFMSKIE